MGIRGTILKLFCTWPSALEREGDIERVPCFPEEASWQNSWFMTQCSNSSVSWVKSEANSHPNTRRSSAASFYTVLLCGKQISKQINASVNSRLSVKFIVVVNLSQKSGRDSWWVSRAEAGLHWCLGACAHVRREAVATDGF